MDDFKHNLGKANLQAKLCDCNLHAKFQVSFHQVVTTLVAIFEDAILQMNINLEHCHRHCYDGASGTKKGVAKGHCHQGVMCHLHLLLWACLKPWGWWHSQAVLFNEVSIKCDGRNQQAHQEISQKRCVVLEAQGKACTWYAWLPCAVSH